MADTHNINSALLTALNKMGVGEIKAVKLRTSEDMSTIQFEDGIGRIVKISVLIYESEVQ